MKIYARESIVQQIINKIKLLIRSSIIINCVHVQSYELVHVLQNFSLEGYIQDTMSIHGNTVGT